MTREEAIQRLKTTDACDSELCEALDMAIKALEQMPCGDFISREYVIKLLENTKRTRKEITNRIYEVQSVSPQPKMGRWIYTGDYITDGMLKCSECGFEHDVSERFSYCPNCGAKMQEVEE